MQSPFPLPAGAGAADAEAGPERINALCDGVDAQLFGEPEIP